MNEEDDYEYYQETDVKLNKLEQDFHSTVLKKEKSAIGYYARPGDIQLKLMRGGMSDGDGRARILMNGWLEVSLHQADITVDYSDAIVNPTNERL